MTSGRPTGGDSVSARASAGPQLTRFRASRLETIAIRTGSLGCRWIVAPTRREPPVDRLRATRSVVRRFFAPGMVSDQSSAPMKEAAEAPFPARAACWGAVVIRETASRSVRTRETKNTIPDLVNEKPRSRPDGDRERGGKSPLGRFLEAFWRLITGVRLSKFNFTPEVPAQPKPITDTDYD
jgi:hypothetical protein